MALPSVSRRRVLHQAATAAFVGGVGSLAGCASWGNGSADDGEPQSPTSQAQATDTATATPTAAQWTGPDYGRWLPAPQTVIPVSQYRFGRLDLAAFAEHRDGLPPAVKKTVQRWQPVEIDWRTVPMVLGLHGNQVIETDFDRSMIVDQVTGTDRWSDPSSYEGYTVVQRDDKGKAIAVGDGAIIIADKLQGTAADTARGLIDTAQGRVTQYPAANEAIDALLDEFDEGFIHQWLPVSSFGNSPQTEPEFDGEVGIGKWAAPVDGPTTSVKYIVVYRTPDAVDMAQVRSFVENHQDKGESFAPWQDIKFRKNGPLAVIEGAVQRGT